MAQRLDQRAALGVDGPRDQGDMALDHIRPLGIAQRFSWSRAVGEHDGGAATPAGLRVHRLG